MASLLRAFGLVGILLLAVLLPTSHSLFAQGEPGTAQANEEAIRFFMDCQASGCDTQFIRDEIRFVNHVRDIRDSDVYLIATSQSTGAGGARSELIFEGRGRFEGMVDTLSHVSGFDATPDEERENLTRLIKIGLMRYVGLTPLAGQVDIRLVPPEPTGGEGRAGGGGTAATRAEDPWDFWVFGVSGSGGLSGRTNYRSRRFSGSLSADRVTEDWKVDLGFSTSYSDTRYDYPELDYNRLSIRRSHTLSAFVVRAVAPRWSLGFRGSARNATYYNYDFAGTLSPTLEYSVFPYEEATRRSFTIQYSVDVVYNDYREQTVYFKEKESFLTQSLTAGLGLNRPWGSASAAIEGAHHLEDIDLHHLTIFGSLRFRLVRGLSLSLSGSASRTKDLVTVAADAGDTVEEILLSRRQLGTDYNYSTSISLSYRFGSIFNNVVNPRFGGGGGVPMIIY